MFLWLKTLYRKRAVTWPFIFYTIIWTLSITTATFLKLFRCIYNFSINPPPILIKKKSSG
ncbi:hypothetical protein DVY35_13825 [Enterococcus faecalis]|nr:hypothetical protein DVY43_13870 [Enterococcus faecalis]TKO72051.1 hypothetical protein DVY36_13835 [Enterococcus faecalis]TKP00539.1 hypothetical protein DVY35_13825 [Enterococcus faecalis]